MGSDIHVTAQKNVSGEWVEIDDFGFSEARNYAAFGWLADVRNYSVVPPLSQPRGFPDGYYNDIHDGNHSTTWFYVDELASFDFDQPIEDRRVTRQTGPNSWDGGCTAEPGGGEMTTYRELFGEWFVDGIAALKASGADRIVISFDS